MTHHIDKYILGKLKALNWPDKVLAERSTLSKGQISKLKNGSVDKLSAIAFYLIVKAFEDKFSVAIKIIFPDLRKIKLKRYKPRERNTFGLLMSEYERSDNTIEEIAAKTGITEVRLFELYFRNGSLQAYELILIEQAIGKKPGELFEELYGKP